MPNQALIKQLFGSSSAVNRTDVLILDGEKVGFSPQEELEKLTAILQQNPFPHLYFCRIDEADFNLNFKECFAKGNFTTLGLEKLTKGALKKIMKSLPETVTKIGINRLTSPGIEYLYVFLKKMKRNVVIICGNDTTLQDTVRFEKLSEDVKPQVAETKKEKALP